MVKPLYLYHGSPHILNGECLLPRQARDGNNYGPNSLNGIYASSKIEEALAMIILKSDGVKGGMVYYDRENILAFIHKGWPRQEKGFLHVLPTDTFQNIPEGSFQWVSLEPVKPLKTFEIHIKNHTGLVRKLTRLF